MARVVGLLKNAAAPTLTPSGKESEARAIDPQDSTVTDADGKNPVVVKEAVRLYAKALAAKKAAEEDAADKAEILRVYVGDLRWENAVQGDYHKTYRVVGDRRDKLQYAVDVSEVARFNPIKGVKSKDVIDEHGKDAFDAVVVQEETIKIKDSILSNRAKRLELSKKLEEALGADGIKEFFQKDTIFVVREGMDEKRYTMVPEQRCVLEKMFKQTSDSVKDATVSAD